MFYIKVKATRIDLPADFNIELIIENPLLLQDRIPVPYTTSADFPLTPTNKRMLDHPDRVNNAARVWEYDGVEMGFGARPMYYGTLIIREISGKLSWNFQASDDLSRLKKPMNEMDWGTVSFGEADYAVRINPTWDTDKPSASVDPAPEAYRLHWESAHADELPYTAGAIKKSGSDIPSMYNDADVLEYIYSLYAQNQFYNAYSNEFGDVVPVEQNPSNPSDFTRYAHPVMYPQLRIYHILKTILNLSDENNPFSDADLKKLVLTSHFHPKFRDDLISKWNGLLVDNEYPGEHSPAEELILKIASYQPQMPANEVLKASLNLVAGTLFPYQDGAELRYRIKLAKDVILDTDYIDWDARLGTKLVLSRQPRQAYLYGYDDFNEGPAPVDPGIILSTVKEVVDSVIASPTGEQLFYVQTTDQMILKRVEPKLSPSDSTRYIYEVRHSGMHKPESSGEEGYRITSPLAPMKMAPVVNVTTFYNSISREFSLAYLPVYEGERKVDYKPHIMIHWGVQTNHLFYPRVLPFLSYHNYDAAGNRLGDMSLQWHGPDGLLAKYHTGFKNWMERDRLLAYGEFILSPYVIKDIDLSKRLLVRGRLWWIKKMVVPITKKRIEPIKTDLIEAAVPADETQIPGGSGIGSGGTPPVFGTCYTIEITKGTFDTESDTFQIQFRRPGGALQVTDFYNMPVFSDEEFIYYVYFCSDMPPVLVYEGQPVDWDAIPGVFIYSGGSCSVDGECESL